MEGQALRTAQDGKYLLVETTGGNGKGLEEVEAGIDDRVYIYISPLGRDFSSLLLKLDHRALCSVCCTDPLVLLLIKNKKPLAFTEGTFVTIACHKS